MNRTTTMLKLLFTVPLTIACSGIFAQHAKPEIKAPKDAPAYATGNGVVSTPQVATLSQSVDHRNITTRWANKVSCVSGKYHVSTEVDATKDAKLTAKLASAQPNGKLPEGSPKAITPTIGASFEANWSLVSTPPDNSMAISNGGIIVTANNDEVLYMNTSGTILQFLSWPSFVNDPTLNANIYDPKVIYDSQQDRFVLAVLHGGDATTSKLLLCFSKSNNPMDGWWIYQLTGNPLNDNSWFDFPSLGVSNNEVYITGNLYSSGANQFNQSVIYQVEKAAGYNGTNFNWQYWSGLTATPYTAFTLAPASWGQQGNYGPGILFVSNSSGGNNSIRLWELTDDMSGSPMLNSFTTSVPAYSPGANAQQQGSADLLKTNDCRIMNAFFLDDKIHYVHQTDVGNGWVGIAYYRTNTMLSTQQSTFGAPGVADLAFPTVSSFSTSITDHNVMIGFERSSSNIFPEVGVVNCDNNMQWSNSTLVKVGETFVNVFAQGGQVRWGDYVGSARKMNSNPPIVWMAAGYGANIPQGNVSNTWKTWVAEVGGSLTIDVGEVNGNNGPDMHVFPNPVFDMFTMQFHIEEREAISIELIDAKGAMVKLLYEDIMSPAEYKLTFNRGVLASGTYSLTLRTPERTLAHETVVVDK